MNTDNGVCRLLDISASHVDLRGWPRVLPKTPDAAPISMSDLPYMGMKVGDMWFLDKHHPVYQCFFATLSPRYRAIQDKREPLWVILPDRTLFCVDVLAWAGGTHQGEGWEVSGEAPKITVSPSIHIVGSWHGYLENGELKSC